MKLRFKGSMGVRVVLATALTLLTIADNRSQARGLDVAVHLKKLDGLLRDDIAQRAGGERRVLIRTRPADRAALRKLLKARGEDVLAELDAGDTLSVVVPSDALEALAKSNSVVGISADAIVRAHGGSGLLGGLLGGLTKTLVKTVGALVDTVGNVLDPSMDEGGEPVPPAALRATLGVKDSWTGNGVGVAVIDSGLEMSAEFQGRVTAFYDFTNGKSALATPSDEYGHGTHVAGTIAGSGALSTGKAYHGLAPSVDLVVMKVLDGTGAGYTSDVVRAIGRASCRERVFVGV